MGRFTAFLLFVVAVLFAAPLAAQDFAGTYIGSGTAEGSVAELIQNGTVVTGTIRDPDGSSGTLQAQAVNAGRMEGTLTIGDTMYTFWADLSRPDLYFTLYDTQGNQAIYAFRETGGATPVDTTQPRIDAPPAANAEWYAIISGQQTGPLTVDELVAAVRQGAVGRGTMVWKQGTEAWVAAETVAELSAHIPPPVAPEATYYAMIGGVQTGPMALAELIARVEEKSVGRDTDVWKSGTPAWVKAADLPELEASLALPVPPPPPPPPPPQSDVPPPPPPPAPPPPPEASGTDPEPVSAPDEDEADAGDAAGLDDALEGAIRAVVTEAFSGLGEEEREELRACFSDAFAPLSAEDRQLVHDAELNPPEDVRNALEERYPGLNAAVAGCSALAEPSAADQASTTVELPGDRAIMVYGSSSVEATDTGYRFLVDGHTVTYEDGVVTVDGVEVEAPDFPNVLDIEVINGEVILSGQ